MLRLIYSGGYQIPLIALKLYKDYNIDPFYALWIAYHMKNSVNTCSSDYGDIFTSNIGFMSSAEFTKRFFDESLNQTVQGHFKKQSHPLAEYIASDNLDRLSGNHEMTTFLLGKKESWELIKKALTGQTLQKNINQLIADALSSIGSDASSVKFVFNKKLFNSVVVNAQYEGLEIPNSRLGRIVFKDENETVLSILKMSKFIKIA
jgi:hypothetical protein